MQPDRYPVTPAIDYPDRSLNRLTTLLSGFTAIPICVVPAAASGGSWPWTPDNHVTTVLVGAGGLLFFAPFLMIVFRRTYPRWWFDWNLGLQRFANRVPAYLALVADADPPLRLAP